MGNPLALPLPPASVPFSQPANLASRFPNDECLDVRNVADDREVHSAIVPELHRAVNPPSNAMPISRVHLGDCGTREFVGTLGPRGDIV